MVKNTANQCSSLKQIFVIVGNGGSDIGKAWLLSGIGGINPQKTLPMKIDPLLNLVFPPNLGVSIKEICSHQVVDEFMKTQKITNKDFKISEDMATYASVGMTIYPEFNLVSGQIMNRFLHSEINFIRPNEVKKRTFNDFARFFALEISERVKKRIKENVFTTLIIEIGGSIEDNEHIYMPAVLRFLSQPEFLGINPEILLLSFFEYSEYKRAFRVKTQTIRRGIATVQEKYYGLLFKECFVRRRYVPNSISNTTLEQELDNIAFETQTPREKLILIPNVKSPSCLISILKPHFKCLYS